MPATVETAEVPVVILAGGRGARFDYESHVRPKPLIRVAGRPIIEHIMASLRAQGFRRFIIAAGYLGHQFYDGPDAIDRDASTEPWWSERGAPGVWNFRSLLEEGVTASIVDTGADAHTGERLSRVLSFLGNRRFVLTYGDGLSDVSMRRVLAQHDHARLIKQDDALGWDHPEAPLVTVTAVHPPGRFGVLEMPHRGYWQNNANVVESFQEKPSSALINGGFMVMEPEFVRRYLDPTGTEACRLEQDALPRLARDGRMQAYVHEGYWRCMDTRRDLEQIEEDVRIRGGDLPWMTHSG